jgi:capsular polysaccharide transport system permease protein
MKRFDTVVARILVEIVSSFLGVCLVCVVLLCVGADPVPVDLTMAIGGYLTAIALGIGVGTISVGICSVFPGWALGYILVTLTLYLSSGVYFMACYRPDEICYYMKWNSITQIIEWVRLGYDPTIPVHVDYLYLFGWVFGSLTIGLLMERYVVRAQQ